MCDKKFVVGSYTAENGCVSYRVSTGWQSKIGVEKTIQWRWPTIFIFFFFIPSPLYLHIFRWVNRYLHMIHSYQCIE